MIMSTATRMTTHTITGIRTITAMTMAIRIITIHR
jgi:hypothetical protein